jgi:hypothetical protein
LNTTEHLSDVISAASLVLAVLAALYTLWLPEVSAALHITPKQDPDDRDPQRQQANRAFWTKAVPLALATSAGTSILLPRGMAILGEAWDQGASGTFDDVKALFILTLALLLLLTIVAIAQLVGLAAMRRKLGPKKPKP